MALPHNSAPLGRSQSPKQEPESLDRLSKYFESTPDMFFSMLLTELLALNGVLAGQVWGLNPLGQLSRISTTDISRFQAFEHSAFVAQHRDLISRSLFSGKPLSAEFRESGNHVESERLLKFLPLHMGTECVGVVELIQESNLDQHEQFQLEAIVAQASLYLGNKSHQAAHSQRLTNVESPGNSRHWPPESGDKTELPATDGSTAKPHSEFDSNRTRTNVSGAMLAQEQADTAKEPIRISSSDVESFVLLLHNQSDLAYVSATSVTEARRLTHSDRISLATMTNGTVEINAISGQDSVARKSNIVRAMQNIATQAIKSGQEIRFEAGSEPTSTGSFELAAEYLDEAGASWVNVIPIFAPEKIDFESNVHRSDQVPFAALILELFSNRPTPNVQDIQRLTPHIAQAVFFALDQEQVFLLPIRRRIGHWIDKSKLTRSRLILAVLLVAMITSALTLIKVPYHIRATGRLMPVEKFRAYAPFDGQVQRVWVESGQAVKRDQPLVSVYGETLASRNLTLQNDLAEKKKLLSAYKAQLDETADQLSPVSTISLNTKVVQLSVEIRGLTDQLHLVTSLLERSHIKSEIDGQISTFRPGDLLENRPVSRGELLLEVMNEQGAWHLELQLPEKRFGHLLDEIQSGRTDHPVTFVQATCPEQTLKATVQQVSTRVSIPEDGAPTVMIHATLNPDQSFRKTIGADVIARIQCGERSLGYVWFGDIIDGARQGIWQAN